MSYTTFSEAYGVEVKEDRRRKHNVGYVDFSDVPKLVGRVTHNLEFKPRSPYSSTSNISKMVQDRIQWQKRKPYMIRSIARRHFQ